MMLLRDCKASKRYPRAGIGLQRFSMQRFAKSTSLVASCSKSLIVVHVA